MNISKNNNVVRDYAGSAEPTFSLHQNFFHSFYSGKFEPTKYNLIGMTLIAMESYFG